MGLTSWKGSSIKKADTEVAKNYLNSDEVNILNRLVSMYLDFAELQALNQKPMYMKNWLDQLDDFLKMTSREILSHRGSVSHESALSKARSEYIKYQKQREIAEHSHVEGHFLEVIEEIKRIQPDESEYVKK